MSPTMLLSSTFTLLFLQCISAEFAAGGWQQYPSNGVSNFGSNHVNIEAQPQHLSALGSFGGGEGWSGGWNSGHLHIGGWGSHQHTHAIPVGEHIEISKPIAIPVYKNIGVPVAQPIGIPVAHVTAIGVPQPYPVHVPVAQPVAIPVIKTIATIVEKKVPFPVEKLIPVPVEKRVPIPIEKHIPVPVEKPYPVHVPIYKHVFHRHKSHGWDR